jgi:hypothetical protein
MAVKILKNQYNWKKDEDFLASIVAGVEYFGSLGGIPKAADFADYPGDQKYI